jgi:RNA polymerase sigma factor (sigma-70 family)
MRRSIAATSDASDALVSMQRMHEQQIQRQIAESMQVGAASILDRSCILDGDELVEAAALARSGDAAAAARVVDGMSQLVFRMAESYIRKWATHLPEHASFDDVFAGGLEGLQKGVARFDEARGYKFTTYATWWIRNGVQHAIYDAAGGGSIRAKALVGGVAPDDPLAGGALLSLDYQPDGERAMHEQVASPLSEGEPFDVELVRSIYDLLSCVDPSLPAIVDYLHRDYAYREIARLVRLPIAEVKRLHGVAVDALTESGLVDSMIQGV